MGVLGQPSRDLLELTLQKLPFRELQSRQGHRDGLGATGREARLPEVVRCFHEVCLMVEEFWQNGSRTCF